MTVERPTRIPALFYLVTVILSACRPVAPVAEPTLPNSFWESPTPTAHTQVTTCVESSIPSSPDPDYSLPGSLVYSYKGSFHLIGGNPLADQLVPVIKQPGDQAHMIGFSPDGKWFAYFTGSAYEGHPYKIHLISDEGDALTAVPEYEIVPVQKGDYTGTWSVRWLTNDYMLIAISDPTENYRNRSVYAVINPFTGKWVESALDDLPRRATARHHEGAIAFDHDFKRVLYAAYMENEAGFAVVAPVLWDLERRTELWRGPGLFDSGFTYGYLGTASWSPDGSWVAFVGPENPDFPGRLHLGQQGVYLLDRNGGSLRLVTDFSILQEAFSAGGLGWSPDGRYLAFQVMRQTDAEGGATCSIYLYDTETDQVTYLCIRQQAVYFDMETLIWSPDSRYLAYTSTDYPPGGSRVVRSLNVINIYTGEVVIVAEPVGQLGGWSGLWP